MKPTIEKIKCRFVVKVKIDEIEEMFSRRKKKVATPSGFVHIFETVTETSTRVVEGEKVEKKDISLVAQSFCKKARFDIGEETRDYEKLPAGMSLCPECERAWKDDPRSPWKAWTSSVHARV